jgi:hypothetical protein
MTHRTSLAPIGPPGRLVFFNGISAASSEYIFPPASVEELIRGGRRRRLTAREAIELRRLYREGSIRFGDTTRTRPTTRHYRGTRFGVQPDNLASAGWGVVFSAGADPAVREALRPLLELRCAEAEDRYREYWGGDAYRPGESALDFKGRMGAGPGPVDPAVVPYHLLLVGGPDEIPFHVQHQLDTQHAVGRLDLGNPKAYARYAEKVIAAERRHPADLGKTCFFATRHPDDPATQASSEQLVLTLARELSSRNRDGLVQTLVAEQATKTALHDLLSRQEGPGLVFTATHGVELPTDDPRRRSHQGALLCQEWEGPPRGKRRPIPAAAYFSADDVCEQPLGRPYVLFSYACFSAGSSGLADGGARRRRADPTSAPRQVTAELPRRLLAAGGALAVAGHVDRTWGCSFLWESRLQPQTFVSTLESLLAGRRIGTALDAFALWRGELSGYLVESDGEAPIEPWEEARISMVHRDARQFILLGDPAVRVPSNDSTPTERGGPRGTMPLQLDGPGVRRRPARTDALDEHLEFAARMLEVHDLPSPRARELRDSIQTIRDRCHDPNLYLAVVGEFSSGKSLLVNHLLRDDLLATSVVQATTSTVTLIRVADRPSIEVEWTRGGCSRIDYAAGTLAAGSLPRAFQRAAVRLTSCDDVAQQIRRVTLGYPFPSALRDLVLVDTPGTNVEDPRHGMVTAEAMRELCDAAIVVVPALTPVSQTLAELLKRHLEGALDRCIFLVTFIDRIAPEERPELLATVRGRLERMLDVDRPVVLSADLSGPPAAGLGALERWILDHVGRHRELILVQGAARLLATLLREEQRELQRLEARYRAERRSLEEARIDDLPSYLARRRERHLSALSRAAGHAEAQALGVIATAGHRVQHRLERRLRDVANNQALRSVVREEAPAGLEGASREVADALVSCLEQLHARARSETDQFQSAFVKVYDRLAAAAGEKAEPAERRVGAGRLRLDGRKVLASLVDSVGRDEEVENQVAGGGALAGAVAGQLLIPIPVVGALVGGLAGLLLGSGLTASPAEVQGRYTAELKSAIKRWAADARAGTSAAVGAERERLEAALNRVIDDHANRYGELVDRTLAADQERAAELQRLEESVQADSAEIRNRQENLRKLSGALSLPDPRPDDTTGDIP